MKIVHEFDMRINDYPSLKGYEIEADSIDELLKNGFYPDPFKEVFNGNIYYALKGCYKDYLEYCLSNFKSHVASKVLNHFGWEPYTGPVEEYRSYQEAMEREVKPWYISNK